MITTRSLRIAAVIGVVVVGLVIALLALLGGNGSTPTAAPTSAASTSPTPVATIPSGTVPDNAVVIGVDSQGGVTLQGAYSAKRDSRGLAGSSGIVGQSVTNTGDTQTLRIHHQHAQQVVTNAVVCQNGTCMPLAGTTIIACDTAGRPALNCTDFPLTFNTQTIVWISDFEEGSPIILDTQLLLSEANDRARYGLAETVEAG